MLTLGKKDVQKARRKLLPEILKNYPKLAKYFDADTDTIQVGKYVYDADTEMQNEAEKLLISDGDAMSKIREVYGDEYKNFALELLRGCDPNEETSGIPDNITIVSIRLVPSWDFI